MELRAEFDKSHPSGQAHRTPKLSAKIDHSAAGTQLLRRERSQRRTHDERIGEAHPHAANDKIERYQQDGIG